MRILGCREKQHEAYDILACWVFGAGPIESDLQPVQQEKEFFYYKKEGQGGGQGSLPEESTHITVQREYS